MGCPSRSMLSESCAWPCLLRQVGTVLGSPCDCIVTGITYAYSGSRQCGNYTGWNYDLGGSVSSKPQLKNKNQMQSTRGIEDHDEYLCRPSKIAQSAAVSRPILRRQPSPSPAKENSTTQKKGAKAPHGDPNRRTTA